MGIFSDNARQLYECGFSIIPVKGKASFHSYDNYRDQLPSEEELTSWESDHGNCNIGLVVGKQSRINVIDIDAKDKDILAQCRMHLPVSPIESFGSKGFRIFVKHDDSNYGRKIRYKGKDIGDFIVNTQVVIPPSIHPDTNKPYIWTGYVQLGSDSNDDVFDMLPEFTNADLDLFESKLENSKLDLPDDFFKQTNGRNNTLKSICGAYLAKGMKIDDIAPRLVADDLALHSNNPLFSDTKDFKGLSKIPLASAYKFTSGIFKTYMENCVREKKTIPQFTSFDVQEVLDGTEYYKYKLFFDKRFKNSKRDIISGLLKYKDNQKLWQPWINMLKSLKSYASDEGISSAKLDIHFARYEQEAKMEFLFDQSKYDGKDYIGEMMSYVKCSNLTTEECADLFKEWCSMIFTRFYTGQQNSMVIFQGKQGTGKDTFISNMMGGIKPYFSNFTDTVTEKDIFMQVSMNLVINIAEFDKLNNKHPGVIKDLISRESAQFRPSHQPQFQDYRMVASFIGTSNPLNFLTDYTGNRRFVVFENSEIDWSYPKTLQSKIASQLIHLYKHPHVASDSVKIKMSDYINSISPDNPSELLTEIWNNNFASSVSTKSFSEVEETMENIRKSLGWKSIRSVQTELKRLGAQKKSTTGKAREYIKISENRKSDT